MFKGIQNIVKILYYNWTLILITLGLFVGFIKKFRSVINLSNEQKISITKKQIREIVLKMVTDAELEYESWGNAGAIKRSQVIKEIYEKYPILSKIANQEDLISWIDNEIDNSLETLRKLI